MITTKKRLTLTLGTCCLLPLSWYPASLASQQAPAKGLVINILEGEGALNDVRAGTARDPIVEVDDENHKPVAGAVVLFLLPDSGPGGTFLDGTHVFSTTTTYGGRAMAQQFTPNKVSGHYVIRVKANYNGMSAETVIHQENVAPGPPQSVRAAHGLSMKTILIIAGVAVAGGTAAALIATSGGSATTISAGNPIVGPPPVTSGVRLSLHRQR